MRKDITSHRTVSKKYKNDAILCIYMYIYPSSTNLVNCQWPATALGLPTPPIVELWLGQGDCWDAFPSPVTANLSEASPGTPEPSYQILKSKNQSLQHF